MRRTGAIAGILATILASGVAACSASAPSHSVFLAQGPVSPEMVRVRPKRLGQVPYLEISVAKPRRTIIYVHGGPDIATLNGVTDFDFYLATRFSARVIKPVYYGSSERSASAKPVSFEWDPSGPKDENARRITAAYRAYRAGMPQAVREVRSFIERWDRSDTVIVGESFGSLLAALGAQGKVQGQLVLLAPQLTTYEEFWTATLNGTYVPTIPTEKLYLEVDGRDIAPDIFDTPEKAQAFQKAWSLAYYEPWQGSDLGTLLQGVQARTTVILGLKDRVGMVTGKEWERLRANAPASTRLCIDPTLAHEPPTSTQTSRACFERAVLGSEDDTAR